MRRRRVRVAPPLWLESFDPAAWRDSSDDVFPADVADYRACCRWVEACNDWLRRYGWPAGMFERFLAEIRVPV
jgi:hypothetical protein